MDLIKSFLIVLLLLAVTFNGTAFYTTSEKLSSSIPNLRALLSTCKPINEMYGPLSSLSPEVSILLSVHKKKKKNPFMS